jgi:hypothetical protein
MPNNSDSKQFSGIKKWSANDNWKTNAETISNLWWRHGSKVRNVKQFLRECEESLPMQADTIDRAGQRWLAWARGYADRLDPFKNGNFREMIGTL